MSVSMVIVGQIITYYTLKEYQSHDQLQYSWQITVSVFVDPCLAAMADPYIAIVYQCIAANKMY
jgi:hypothetical protein